MHSLLSGKRMRIFPLIFLAITLLTCVNGGWARLAGLGSEAAWAQVAADDFSGFQAVTAGMKPPKATFAPDPKFPELPPEAEQRGTVVLLIGVSTKGRVEAVRVLRSDEPAFEKSAVATVRKWKFKPAEKGGHPVPVQITVEMNFKR